VISPTKSKTQEAVLAWLFLLLDAGQLFHNLLVNGVQKLASAVISLTKSNIRSSFSLAVLIT
ncbi:TPA: hypothetical protein ACLISZ_002232, partial [Enterococcus faecium]